MIRVLAVAAAVLGVLVLTTSASAVPELALHGRVVVSKDGNGEGRVTSEPGGIDCGSQCSFGFVSNDDLENYEPVTLTASASPGSAFEGFNICPDKSCTIDPIEPGKTYQVNATFVRARPVAVPARGHRQRQRQGSEPARRYRLRRYLHGAIRNRQHRDSHRDTDSRLVVFGLDGCVHGHRLVPRDDG